MYGYVIGTTTPALFHEAWERNWMVCQLSISFHELSGGDSKRKLRGGFRALWRERTMT
jgi:hypothetical protein